MSHAGASCGSAILRGFWINLTHGTRHVGVYNRGASHALHYAMLMEQERNPFLASEDHFLRAKRMGYGG